MNNPTQDFKFLVRELKYSNSLKPDERLCYVFGQGHYEQSESMVIIDSQSVSKLAILKFEKELAGCEYVNQLIIS